MSSFSPEFTKSFARETWTLYAVGMLGVCLRFVARIRRLGIRNLQTDDYMMVFAVIWYTILCVSLNEVVIVGGSNLMSEEDIKNLTPGLKADRVRGSKWVFVSEHSFVLAPSKAGQGDPSEPLIGIGLVRGPAKPQSTAGVMDRRVSYAQAILACMITTEASLHLTSRLLTLAYKRVTIGM
ncbi:hypothetical protein APSETT445_007480 [Aspergillus pseudonomiae]